MAPVSVSRPGQGPSLSEVEYLYTERPQSVLCQLCSRNLDPLTIEEREDHYAVHFAHDEQQATGSITGLERPNNRSINLTGGGASMKNPLVSSPSISSSAKRKPPPPEDVFWHPLLNHPPPHNYTPGLIPVLRRMLLKSYAKTNTASRAILCHESATHVAGQQFDRMWGCGYRNFLMASTALVAQQQQQMYFPLIDGDPNCPPGVRNLQRWIEEAWSSGYDKVGAEQLKHKLYGTSKWIGTGEIYVAFTYKGIPAQLVDFPRNKDSSKKDIASSLIQWIVRYFSTAPEVALPPASTSNAFDVLKSASQVTIASLMPLILQHKGHSRTIIGYEVTKNGATNLLIFDPAKRTKADLRRAALQCHDRSRARKPPTIVPTSQIRSDPGPSSTPTAPPTHRRIRSRILKPLKRAFGGTGSNDNEPIIVMDSDDEEPEGRMAKRARGSSQESTDDEVDEILAVLGMGSDESEGPAPQVLPEPQVDSTWWPEERDLDPSAVASYFRVNIGRLSKHDEYQILYFPLTEPLTEFQKRQRVIVRSERVVL
ncbi:hypothetical protein FRB95_000165 [Tulasnella sp. JGI-2019a]|nr:hypothetical protein FRB95_000165 [Tulasnella sp. JGI-2019a]